MPSVSGCTCNLHSPSFRPRFLLALIAFAGFPATVSPLFPLASAVKVVGLAVRGGVDPSILDRGDEEIPLSTE